MRAVIYCRVSTKEQTQNLSLPTQQKACEDYCVREGLEVARIFMEEGESAKTANRTQLQEMLAYCRQHKRQVQVVVVHSLSRFSRETGVHHALRQRFSGLGVAIRSATERIDDSPAGRLLESVIASIAQFDNDMKADRTKVGMRAALESGRWTFQAPIGYQSGGRGGPSLLPEPERAELVREAFELFDSEKYSTRDLLNRLRRRGLVARRGRPLSPQSFRSLLRNPLYVGRIEVAKWGVSVAGDFEAIVSPALFARVQARLRGHAKVPTSRSQDHPDFPLRRFVHCSECARPLTGSWSRGRGARYAYYHCPKCGAVRVARAALEASFMQLLTSLQPRAEYLRLFRAIVLDQWSSRQKSDREARVKLDRKIAVLQLRLDDLDDAFLHRKLIDKRSYDRQRDRVRDQLSDAEVEAAETKQDLDVSAVLAFAEKALTDSAGLWESASPEQKLRVQRAFFPKGVVFDGATFRTAATTLVFAQLPELGDQKEGLASPTGFEVSRRVVTI